MRAALPQIRELLGGQEAAEARDGRREPPESGLSLATRYVRRTVSDRPRTAEQLTVLLS